MENTTSAVKHFSIYFIELGITQNLYKSNKKGTIIFTVTESSKQAKYYYEMTGRIPKN